jgi:uncharacterized protein YndB with AHSA1/START domain/DNA-binding transcriptional ArsR family regulator
MESMDAAFKALADPSRRRLLDALNERNGQNLRELCAGLDMTRQAVAKHLAILEAAGLVVTSRRGRERLHHLNAAPINDIAERWIDRYDRERARALSDLRRALEAGTMEHEGPTEFVYVSYIRTTPEQLWEALTNEAFVRRYWGEGLRSDWKTGSVISHQLMGQGEWRDTGMRVLRADPPRVLSYSWHLYQPEFKDMFGWSDEKFAELMKEKRSKVTFELTPADPWVQLRVTHDDFEPNSEMYRGTRDGWPAILSALKTLLETGDLPAGDPEPQPVETG